MSTIVPIPEPLWERIKEFCAQGKTGQIVMDTQNGQILAWKITESGRLTTAQGSAISNHK